LLAWWILRQETQNDRANVMLNGLSEAATRLPCSFFAWMILARCFLSGLVDSSSGDSE